MTSHITPREQAYYLQAVVKANRERAGHLATTIGSLTEAMYECNRTALDAEAELRTLQAKLYADLEREAGAA